MVYQYIRVYPYIDILQYTNIISNIYIIYTTYIYILYKPYKQLLLYLTVRGRDETEETGALVHLCTYLETLGGDTLETLGDTWRHLLLETLGDS